MDLNIIMLVGRLVHNPDSKYTPNGHPICKFTLAVNGAKDGDALFIDCTAFEQTATVVHQYASKGQQVAVVGRLREDKWIGKDEEKHSKMAVTVSSIQLLSRPQGQTQAAAQPPAKQTAQTQQPNFTQNPWGEPDQPDRVQPPTPTREDLQAWSQDEYIPF